MTNFKSMVQGMAATDADDSDKEPLSSSRFYLTGLAGVATMTLAGLSYLAIRYKN